MSAKLMGMVFEAGPAEATQRFVLLAIADNCDDSGFAYPGVDLLAAKSCQTERNVLRILQALEGDGWLLIKRRSWGVKKRGNSYQLNLARLRKAIEVKTKPVYKASFLSGDKMSLRELREADSIAAAEASGDKLSCEQPAVQVDSRGDNPQGHEVTNSTSRGDKSGIPIRKNHQEPSERTITPQPPVPGGEPPEHLKTGCVECAAVAVARVMRECGLSEPRPGRGVSRAIRAAMEMHLERADAPEGGWQRDDFDRIADRMVRAYTLFLEEADLMAFRVGAPKFFAEGWWWDRARWPYDPKLVDKARRRL